MSNFENYQQNNPAPPPPTNQSSFGDEFKSFYKGDFKSIMSLFFSSPIDGTRSIFVSRSDKAYTSALILFVSVFLVYFVGTYLAIPEKFKDALGLELMDFIKIGLLPIVFMLFATLLTFAIKSSSGKPEFKTELLTGGLSGIPMAVLFIFLFGLRFFGEETFGELFRDPQDLGTFMVVFLLFIFLMLVNVVQQSLKASGSKDAIAWYASPLVVLLSFYFTYKFVDAIF
jgi:hypothetical protein